MLARVSMLRNVTCLVTALLAAACGGDNSGDRNDSSGGTSSNGGGGGMSNASGGTGGMAALVPYPCEAKPIAISDFTATIAPPDGKWGTSATLSGGSFLYGDANADGVKDIAATYAPGEVALKGHIGTYSGYGMWFGAATDQTYPCSDASAYLGLSFEVVNNGTVVPNINAQVQHHDDSPVDTANKRGGCVWTSTDTQYSDCVYPNTVVVVPTDGTAIQVPWAMFGGGKPIVGAEGGAKLDGLQWEFWNANATPYDLDIVIKNIKFYQ